MKQKSEKLTLGIVGKLFANQNYDFKKIRKNVLIYNYDKWAWVGGSFFGNKGVSMPYTDQIQRAARYLRDDVRFADYELAGLVMAGVQDYGAREGMKIIAPKLEKQGLHHVYNVIVRDAKTGNIIPMPTDWAYGGLFDDRKYLESDIISTVLIDLCARDDSMRQVIFDGLARQR